MVKVDWHKTIVQALRVDIRKWYVFQWLLLLTSQVRQKYAEIELWWFDLNYYLKHNGQVIYLEKVLNDLFDNTLRRIYIDDGDFSNRTLLYWRSEGEDDIVIYWRWVQRIYDVGDKVQHNGHVWLCLVANGDKPGTSVDWQDEGEVRMFFTNGGIDFYVIVPIGLVYDLNRMKALINKYKLADKTYKIIEI